ncbi:MAG: aspartate-semialdehyde dehydrogenase [Clostridia bacterium]|nr:aspartate-semialdehyde dehydrogenase [Clostridia bacterium]
MINNINTNKIKIAIVGATGLVGRTILKVLEEKNFKNVEYTLFASEKSEGKKIEFLGKNYIICKLEENSFDNKFDFAIFSAGAKTALKYAPIAVSRGCTVIDNSSAFRMDKSIPLVVPEVNKEKIFENNGIISNPNCSTIQAVVPLKILDDKYKIKRIVYSTYQAVSGAGKKGLEDLEQKENGLFYDNCVPQIDVFLDDGYTKEEHKMINETRKILDNSSLPITATTVRVPVTNCHSEAINVEFENQIDVYEIKQILQNSEGIILADDIENNIYPLARKANGYNEVFVGRIRRDYSVKNGINMWVVADNLRKGAATNAIQILEVLLNSKNED